MTIKETREGEFECREFNATWKYNSLTINPRDDYMSIDEETARKFARWLAAMVQP